MHFLLQVLHDAGRMIFGFDPEVYLIVWTSLKVSIGAVVLATIVGVPLGLLIALKDFWAKHAVLMFLNTLMALPTVVVGLFFYFLLSRMGPMGDLGLLFSPTAIVLGLFALVVPLVTNLTISAIQAMDQRLFLTCKLLGATAYQQAWLILREARFGVTAAIVIAFGRVISEVGIAMMLGGNIKGFTRTMTTAIALETSKGEFQLGMALGFILLLVAFVVNGALFLLQREER
jgi:tungstate transport system permease protein